MILRVARAGRFELFLDLLYVSMLANFAETLAEDISGAKLIKYIVRVAHRHNTLPVSTLTLVPLRGCSSSSRHPGMSGPTSEN